MGVITKPQGIKGQMRLKYFSAMPEDLARYSRFYDKNGKTWPVRNFAVHSGIPIIMLDGVGDRAQAEQMAGAELFIRRSDLAELEAEDEFYHEDLLGLKAVSEAGEIIGEVSGFFNFGGDDLLEISISAESGAEKRQSGKASKLQKSKMRKELIPFTKAAVPAVDIKAGQVTVNIAAAGLLPAKRDDIEQAEAESAG